MSKTVNIIKKIFRIPIRFIRSMKIFQSMEKRCSQVTIYPFIDKERIAFSYSSYVLSLVFLSILCFVIFLC